MNKFALTTVAAMPRASGFAQALEPEVGKERRPERKEGWDGIEAGPDWFSQGRIEWISDLFKGDAFGFILRDQPKDEIADYLAHCEAKQGMRPIIVREDAECA